ncbi:hypothetical protein AAFC00_006119 [Neodothiora populina]|uniref:Mitochondrial import inner membrane translocase subunit TIM50 n=1 Tax=Neodothiora populina TaxID=2781224 RepID=A0ABR3P495_9PEZI
MLSRAAARAFRAQQPARATAQPPFSLAIRGYAKAGKPRPTQFIKTNKASPAAPSTSAPSPAPSAVSGAARQTSPGTTIPKNQTWKPQDSIKFGGPAATAATGGAAKSATTPASSTSTTADVDRNGPAVPPPQQQSPEITEAAEAEPIAPKTPLPDLRQGIPSTFFEEFNKSEAAKNKSSSATEDKIFGDEATSEGASSSSGSGGRRGGEDEEFDRSAYETSIDRKRAQLSKYGYLAMATLVATAAAYCTRPYDDDENPEGLAPEHLAGWAPAAMWARMTARWSSQKGYYTEPTFNKLLPEVPEAQRPPYTLVLSLEDLMIHSEWTREHGWRTAKRPGIDYFLRYLSQYYELVLFTSVPVAMADPVVKKLDPFRIIQWPLFREGTRYENGEYVKDLSYLNRPLEKTIIIDTKAAHVKNQPENAIVLPKWTGSPKDEHTKDLVALIPFLEYVATMGTEDVRKVIESFKGKDIPIEFARRESLAREAFHKQLAEEAARKPKKSLGGLLNKALGIKAAPGGMTLDNETTVAEGLAQGKMLSDQIRERGQREYERLDREIRVNGAKWLKEMEEEEKKFMEGQMKEMRSSWFGFGGGPKPASS